jgi:DNA sulfur modification protein DndE
MGKLSQLRGTLKNKMVNFTRIKISIDATTKLQTLKGRTGLTPNILSRIALCYSLNKSNITDLVPFDDLGQEFNRHTFMGEYDSIIAALVREKCILEGLDPEKDFLSVFNAHLNNGIMAIYARVKNISDFTNLME